MYKEQVYGLECRGIGRGGGAQKRALAIHRVWADEGATVGETRRGCGREPDGAGRSGCCLYTSDAADEEGSVDLGRPR